MIADTREKMPHSGYYASSGDVIEVPLFTSVFSNEFDLDFEATLAVVPA